MTQTADLLLSISEAGAVKGRAEDTWSHVQQLRPNEMRPCDYLQLINTGKLTSYNHLKNILI